MKISKATNRAMTLIEIACVTSVVSLLVLMMLLPFKDPKPLRIKSTNSNKNLTYRIYDSNGVVVVEGQSPTNSIP